jgi:hypothetical protein
MGDDPHPTREGPMVIAVIVIFVFVAAWFLMNLYGAAHMGGI